MNTSHYRTNESEPYALQLGNLIRTARKKKGWTIAQLAEKLGRPREWLNRLELGYSEYGEHKPPSSADVHALIHFLGEDLGFSSAEVLALAEKSEIEFYSLKQNTRKRTRKATGKLTQAEVIIGEDQISQAIVDLIKEQHSDAIIRNTGIKGLGDYIKVATEWIKYREAIGEFLKNNPNGLFKRVEYAATNRQLDLAKHANERLAGGRRIDEVHNARIKFHKHNPLQLHVLIGQREAILAIPQNSGQPGSSMAILVRDKLFVEALRVWYDEVLWESSGPSTMVKFSNFDQSFEDIKQMYGYQDETA